VDFDVTADTIGYFAIGFAHARENSPEVLQWNRTLKTAFALFFLKKHP
jgi:hypothetical protein